MDSLDKNHLISTGSEGRNSSNDSMEIFERTHLNPNIDYLTMHIWPKNWNWYKADDADQSKDELPDRVHLKELTQRIVSLGIVQQMPTVQQYQFFQEVIDRIEIDNQKRVLGIYLKGWKTNIL